MTDLNSHGFPGSSRKRALLVGNFLSSRIGGRSVCEDLAERLGCMGWTVKSTSSKVNKVSRLLEMSYAVVRERQDYDVAHVDVYSGPAFVWAEIAVRLLHLLRKPIIVTLHGGALPDFARRYPRRVGRVLKLARCITSPSGYLKDELQFLGLKVRLIPNAIDVGAYAYTERKPAGPRFVWLRAIHGIYNPRLAVEVISSIRRTHPDACLYFFGSSKDAGELEALTGAINELDLKDSVRIMGRVEKRQVSKALNLGDIFLNTTNVDNTPVSVVEAMASGLCVVSTNVGGMPYLVRSGHNGLLVSPRNISEMVSAVRRILDDQSLASMISRNGRQTAESMDWSVILPEWDALFSQLSQGADGNSKVNAISGV